MLLEYLSKKLNDREYERFLKEFVESNIHGFLLLKENVKVFLKEHPDKAKEIEVKIRAEAFSKLHPIAETVDIEELDLDV